MLVKDVLKNRIRQRNIKQSISKNVAHHEGQYQDMLKKNINIVDGYKRKTVIKKSY